MDLNNTGEFFDHTRNNRTIPVDIVIFGKKPIFQTVLSQMISACQNNNRWVGGKKERKMHKVSFE